MDVQIVGVGLRMVLSVWAAVMKVVWVLVLYQDQEKGLNAFRKILDSPTFTWQLNSAFLYTALCCIKMLWSDRSGVAFNVLVVE